MAYTKLFSSIVTSTLWCEDSDTRVVWFTILALADKHGEVTATIPGLARIACVSLESCEAALAKFLASDKYSRTKTAEGRRLEEIEGGWALINHEKYRRMASKEDAVEKNAERQRRFKERKTVTVTQGNASVTPANAQVTQGNASVTPANAQVTQGNASVTPANAQVTQDRDIAEAEADSYTVPPFSNSPPPNSVANATDERRSSKAIIFQEFLPWMNQRAGKDCRSVLGLLCSNLGDDDALATLAICKEADPVDPIGWISARMRPRETNDQRKDRELRETIERSKLQ